MLNIKSLTTGVAVAALVSAIGLAYAQSPTYPQTTGTTPAATMATTPAPMRNTMPSTTNPSDTLNATVTEPGPKADRN